MKTNTGSFRVLSTTAIAALLVLSAPTHKLHAQSVMRFNGSLTWVGNAVEEGGFLFSAPIHQGFVNGGGLNFWNPAPGLNNSFSGTYTIPYDGSQYAQPFTSSEPVLTQSNGTPFRLESFDLAPYSAGLGANVNTFYITGYYANGGTVSTQVVWTGVVQGQIGDFHTYSFSPNWTNLSQVVMHVDIANYGDYAGFSIDNITVVPEPGTLTLVVLGLTGLMFTFAQSHRRQH